jgi:hypothetical protein
MSNEILLTFLDLRSRPRPARLQRLIAQCFSCLWKLTGTQGEFAIASALTAIEPTPTRFSAALAALGFAPQTNPANGFPPFLAVAGISDPTVRSSYLDWFDTLNGAIVPGHQRRVRRPFCSAVVSRPSSY